MDKWFWWCVIIACVGITALAIWGNQFEVEFEQKCKDAGGVPSKYHIMVGKVHHTERACLHPSAIINVE